MSSLYVNPKVSKKALNKFLAHFQPDAEELHTFQLFHHDNLILRLAPSPYNPADKREVYSLSKSFCSTAIGILVDDGLVSLDDRIIDIFPDDVPEVIDDKLSGMKLRHVLSMTTGHGECIMKRMIHAENPPKAFLAEPLVYEPGSTFVYNTGATCLLSCIVTKKTGLKLVDFLTKRLFRPLGIEDIRWNATDSGINEGGCGCHVCSDDIVKLGLLYLHKGVWNGKRIISEKWVNEATSKVSNNNGNGTDDWCAGYGFQFWINYREGFRGDGAYGQLCVVLPEHDMVVATQTELYNMQSEMDAITELVYHLYDSDDEYESVKLPLYLPAGSAERTSPLESKLWKMCDNPIGWSFLQFAYHAEDDAMHIICSDSIDQYVIKAGNGKWIENTIVAKMFKPKLVGLMSAERAERCRFAASYEITENGIHLFMRYLNCPHKLNIDFTLIDGRLDIRFTPRGNYHEGVPEMTAEEI